MDIRIFKREWAKYRAYHNGKRVGQFDYAVPIIIVGVSQIGGVFYSNNHGPACWSPNWVRPGPALKGKPKCESCLKLGDDGLPITDDGSFVAACPMRSKECMPVITIAFAVHDEVFNREVGGLRLWSYTFIGDEVSGRADHDERLYSPRSFLNLLNIRSNNDCAKHKVFLKWSSKHKRTFIHVPEDTRIGNTVPAEQKTYEMLVKMMDIYEQRGKKSILLSSDPRLWYNKISKEGKQKLNEKAVKKKGPVNDTPEKRISYLNMVLKRKNLKPKTREDFQNELDELQASLSSE